MGDAASPIGCGDGLMNDGRCLRRRRNRFGVERNVAKQQIGFSGLNKIGPMRLSRHVAGDRQHRRVISGRFVETGDKMRASGAGGAAADAELTRQLSLAGGGERAAFFMTNTNPFNPAPAHGVGERIQ